MVANRVRHTVAFTLVHEDGSAEERDFLEAAEHLATIPGVEAFELLAEVSPKNGYRFGISMEFADRSAYATTSTPITSASFSSAGWPK
jgi:Stress responsive A/B Barrel Domain